MSVILLTCFITLSLTLIFLLPKNCLSAPLWDDVVSHSFIYNSYFAHPENLCFCAIMSKFSSQEVKEQAKEKILEFRKVKRKSKAKKFRKFVKPTGLELNLEADNIMGLVKWPVIAKKKKTSSPLLDGVTDAELPELLKEGDNDVKKKVAKILCHQQFNEQFVQMVAKSVSKVVSHDGQKSKIICTKQSQEDIPILCTKKDFKLRRKLFD